MSVKIRLSRTGKTHQVSYRIVALDTRTKRDGKYADLLGYYNPHAQPSLNIDKAKLDEWTKKGARPTQAVKNLLEKGTLIAKKKKKKEKKPAQEATPQPQPETAQTDDSANNKPAEPRTETQPEKAKAGPPAETAVETAREEPAQEVKTEETPKPAMVEGQKSEQPEVKAEETAPAGPAQNESKPIQEANSNAEESTNGENQTQEPNNPNTK